MKIRQILKDIKGATVVEYALIASIIALAIVVGFQVISGAVQTKYTTVGTAITNSTTGSSGG
ncbi:Flp family type IVb pilin [Pseudemcibacter aquimaris]|uniref:Flp family type IVb pilin n=1 Tax=Pseudemcibacter aquimaris TaxID=2857064 RepID=UPI003B8393E9|nr:Flp family type IVb pilin [Pseudemcibacter aquimaris]WDU58214.1 Flp family type IVb pilin [Pseudemcibacter aquimaris]